MKLYPECRFILLARDPVETCVTMVLSWSDFNKAGTDEEKLDIVNEASSKISRFYKLIDELEKELPGNAYKMAYESLVGNMQETLVKLSRALVVTNNYNWSQVKKIESTDIMSARNKHGMKLQNEIRAICKGMLTSEQDKYLNDFIVELAGR